ncbi:MAG: MotA/TolQ/ExbB proton channel family protein [Lentisphaeria bacterium]|nr:MotA/TolQ/ExbB proton channel family protein [Lentisphaeria bacterium]
MSIRYLYIIFISLNLFSSEVGEQNLLEEKKRLQKDLQEELASLKKSYLDLILEQNEHREKLHEELENIANEKHTFIQTIQDNTLKMNHLLSEIPRSKIALSSKKSDLQLYHSLLIDCRRELPADVGFSSPELETLYDKFDNGKTVFSDLDRCYQYIYKNSRNILLYPQDFLSMDGHVVSGESISFGLSEQYLVGENIAGWRIESNSHNIPEIYPLEGDFKVFDNNSSGAIFLPFDLSQKWKTYEAPDTSLYGYLKRGGLIVWPLITLGMLTLVICAYKSIYLWRIQVNFDSNAEETVKKLSIDNIEAEEFVSSLKSYDAEILKAGVRYAFHGDDVAEEAMNEVILRNISQLEKGLAFISLTAGVAPLLGLLGTVMGIIKTFQQIAYSADSKSSQMAEGISEALITTELGLIVAVPAFILYAILNRRMKIIVNALEKAMLGFLNGIKLKEVMK